MAMANTTFNSNRMAILWSAFLCPGQIANCIDETVYVQGRYYLELEIWNWLIENW